MADVSIMLHVWLCSQYFSGLIYEAVSFSVASSFLLSTILAELEHIW